MVGKISIWFFVGSLLLIYGIIILSANIYQYIQPSFGTGFVLENLHAGIWWGALLIIIGLVYIILFKPGKVK